MTSGMPDTSWADQNATVNQFGSKEYSRFVCHIMNLFDPRAHECSGECCWVSPFGWVPEAGCSIHD
jgi:hypothetical protein